MLDALVGANAQPATRESFRKKLRDGRARRQGNRDRVADSRLAGADVEIPGQPGAMGMVNLGDMLRQGFGGRTKRVRTTVKEAYEPLVAEESRQAARSGADRAGGHAAVEEDGIVFLDEIDKIALAQRARAAPTCRARACSAICCR